MNRWRVLLAEDHALVRAGFRALLESVPGVESVTEAADGRSALATIESLHPDLVVMDVSMPGVNGIEVTRIASKARPAPRILMLSMHADREYVIEALLAGASGYMLKHADRSELEMAVAAVARGDVWLSPAIARTVVDDLVRAVRALRGATAGAGDTLTERQREILQFVAEGHSSKEIARRLRLSLKTVETHRSEIMSRLGIHHVAGLVRYAVRTGIVSRDE